MITNHFKSHILESCLLIPVSCLLLLAACGRKETAPPPPPPPVHDLVLRNLADEFPGQIRTADHAGQVQWIVFLRTDDAPCRGSIPDWNALQAEFADRGFTVIGIAIDDRSAPEIAAETRPLGAIFPLGHADAPVIAAFGGLPALRAIPTSFLLSRDGSLLNTYPGFEPWPLLRADIDAALDNLPLPSLAVDVADEAKDAE